MKRRLASIKVLIPRRACPHRLHSSSATGTADRFSNPPASPNTNVDSPSVKPRKWGNRALPLSPLMDPVKIEQRNRHKRTKLPPPKNVDLSPFQKTLVNNPYARALATNVRRCRITKAHLPSFFHIPLEMIPHPDPPHHVCIVPARLFADVNPNVSREGRGASQYISGRQSVLKHVQTAKKAGLVLEHGTREKWHQERWKGLGVVVLGLLQDAVVKSLRWGLQHPKAGLVMRCDDGASGVESIDGAACFIYQQTLWPHSKLEAEIDKNIWDIQSAIKFIEKESRRQKNLDTHVHLQKLPSMTVAASRPIVRYPRAPYRDRIIPVYSLTDLLGEDKMGELLKDTAFEETRAFAVKEGNLTTKIQMALLRLQTYLN